MLSHAGELRCIPDDWRKDYLIIDQHSSIVGVGRNKRRAWKDAYERHVPKTWQKYNKTVDRAL